QQQGKLPRDLQPLGDPPSFAFRIDEMRSWPQRPCFRYTLGLRQIFIMHSCGLFWSKLMLDKSRGLSLLSVLSQLRNVRFHRRRRTTFAVIFVSPMHFFAI